MSDHLQLPIDGETYYTQDQLGDNLLDNFSSSVMDGEEDSGCEDDLLQIRKIAEKNNMK